VTSEQRKSYTEAIYAHELLGCHVSGFNLGPLTAFCDGLRTDLIPSLPGIIDVSFLIPYLPSAPATDYTFQQTIGQGALLKNLLTSICGQRLSDPQDMVDLFKYETVNEHLSITSTMVLNTNDTIKLKALMKRYFHGAGHPMHVNWDLTHVNQEARDLVAEDKLMRSRRLLSMITGSELLPVDKDVRIYVSFV
jgi:hypothetical protein